MSVAILSCLGCNKHNKYYFVSFQGSTIEQGNFSGKCTIEVSDSTELSNENIGKIIESKCNQHVDNLFITKVSELTKQDYEKYNN